MRRSFGSIQIFLMLLTFAPEWFLCVEKAHKELLKFHLKKTHSVVDELASGSIEVKTIEDLSDCKHSGDFWVVATIIHVELDRGWCYLAFKVCAKKLDKEGKNSIVKNASRFNLPLIGMTIIIVLFYYY